MADKFPIGIMQKFSRSGKRWIFSKCTLPLFPVPDNQYLSESFCHSGPSESLVCGTQRGTRFWSATLFCWHSSKQFFDWEVIIALAIEWMANFFGGSQRRIAKKYLIGCEIKWNLFTLYFCFLMVSETECNLCDSCLSVNDQMPVSVMDLRWTTSGTECVT